MALSDTKFRIAVVASTVVIGLAITGGALWLTVGQAPGASTGPGSAVSSAAARAPAVPDLARRIPGDPLALGSVHAPVVMVEYADYRCPFCAAFDKETLPALMKRYVDTGVLRIEWREFPVFGQQSIDAAVAGRAAAQQGLFWQYHHALFALAPRMGHADLSRQVLIDTARTVGVPNLTAFTAALDSAKLRSQVMSDAAEAQGLGASGTPTFLVGSEPLVGAQPLSVFSEVIDQQRRAAGR